MKEEKITIVIQVNGKLRSTLEIPTNEAKSKAKVIAMAKKDTKVKKWLKAKKIKKEIYVDGKLVNFVL